MRNKLAGFIPSSLKPKLKRVYYFVIDSVCKLRGRNNLLPPESMIFVGSGDFSEIGQIFKTYFIELANLQPDEKVLDIGCGIGRMAVPLTNYLSKKGGYWGFDIVKSGIDWCQSHISPRFSNFHFQHSDVYNSHYNPSGRSQAQNFQFPFNEESFDFIFLTSVFTHMLPSSLENYLSEISRVLIRWRQVSDHIFYS
ncbi:MAG: methyltransferase domain-containing protein [Stenomitos frigidus ULC029]